MPDLVSSREPEDVLTCVPKVLIQPDEVFTEDGNTDDFPSSTLAQVGKFKSCAAPLLDKIQKVADNEPGRSPQAGGCMIRQDSGSDAPEALFGQDRDPILVVFNFAEIAHGRRSWFGPQGMWRTRFVLRKREGVQGTGRADGHRPELEVSAQRAATNGI